MKVALDFPSEYDEALKDGFWPTTRVAPSFEDEFTKMRNVIEEYDEDKRFVGQACDPSAELFRVNRDLYEGYFMAIRLFDNDKKHLLWIARALSNPNSNPKHLGYILI